MTKKIRVLIVDDSRTIRELFTHMLSNIDDIHVVGTAENALDARDKIKQLNPDVLTLDVEMPHMDGLSFLEKIMTLRPLPVVMVSSLTAKGADISLKALEIGAVDVLAKCKLGSPEMMLQMKQALIDKIRTAAAVKVRKTNFEKLAQHSAKQISTHSDAHVFIPVTEPRLIAIGSSTGGVEALREIIPYLPATMPPVLIAQHMPPLFTASFAKRLDQLSPMNVVEASHGMKIEQGNVYIAPGDFHMRVMGTSGHWRLHIAQDDKVSSHRPSVDVLFHSVAQSAGSAAIGVMLTGMGRDGADGMKAMYEKQAFTIAQDEKTSVVYGMPRAAVENNAVSKIVPLTHIAEHIMQWAEAKTSKRVSNI